MAKPGTKAAARAANSCADSHAATAATDRARPGSGTRQRGHRELLLAGQVQRRAARDQDPQLNAPGKELLDELTRGEHVLEVVQHQQKLAISQVTAQVLQQRSAP